MSHEIELVSDGDGLAVLGASEDVERFLAAEGLSAGSRQFRRAVSSGAAIANATSEIAQNSGRWVKLTKESAATAKKYGLMETKTPGVSHAMIGKPGEVKQWIQIAKGPGSLALNPSVLTGAAGIMSQMAMQQAMEEITAYLVKIDRKVDDVLRAQKDNILAQMVGVGFVLDDAMVVRDQVGRTSETTWSKVQGSAETIAHTQAYALRQLDAIAEKYEGAESIGDLADVARESDSVVREWLAVLARCFQLQDALAVLELDRVLDAAPNELDGHRLGLRAARDKRLEAISHTTETVLGRMVDAARRANAKVLVHPSASPRVVRTTHGSATAVNELRTSLGVEGDPESLAVRRWAEAFADARGKAWESSAHGVVTARQQSIQTAKSARSAGESLVGRVKHLRQSDRERTTED